MNGRLQQVLSLPPQYYITFEAGEELLTNHRRYEASPLFNNVRINGTSTTIYKLIAIEYFLFIIRKILKENSNFPNWFIVKMR